MRQLLAFIAALLCVALSNSAFAQRSYCPTGDSCHGLGRMAMSADARFIAFAVLAQPANQFVLFDTQAQRATVIEAPATHRHIGDFTWSPDGDELTFLTAERNILNGGAQHVWRLRPNRAAPTIDLLAVIPCARLPSLSADGTRLLVAEGELPDSRLNCGSSSAAYAIYERTLSNGDAARRTVGRSRFVSRLFYDRNNALYLGNWDAVQLRSVSGGDSARRLWSHIRGDQNGAQVFRVAPGATLAEQPAPMSLVGAHEDFSLLRVLDNGRVVMIGQLEPLNDSDWYDERGQPRTPTREITIGYVSFALDAPSETVWTPELGTTSGGSDVSSDARYAAHVVSLNAPLGMRPGGERWDREDSLRLYDRGALVFESRVAALTADAPKITLQLGSAPIMPTSNTEARVAS